MFKLHLDFPSGPVVKNLPDNAGDTGSILSPEGSHVLQGNKTHAPQLWSLSPGACAHSRSPCGEKPDPAAQEQLLTAPRGRSSTGQGEQVKKQTESPLNEEHFCANIFQYMCQ